MKILMLSTYDAVGGAARAASRLQAALNAAGMDCHMQVMVKSGDGAKVSVLKTFRQFAARRVFHRFVKSRIVPLQHSLNSNLRSLSIWGSGLVDEINRSDFDVVNIHWALQEMLSVKDISRIKKPLVWTLHDMWAFCGAEHVCNDGEDARWRTGYTKESRPPTDSGPDLDRWTWKRKRKHWKTPVQLVTPSHWLGGCVQSSSLMQGWPVSVIPNPLNLSIYRPWPKAVARAMFSLPLDKPLVLFGAWGSGGAGDNKGGDLLQKALPRIAAELPEVEMIVFGQGVLKSDSDTTGMKIHHIGSLADDYSLALLYSAADVMVVPSRIENFPQSALEAEACGTPVVCFDKSGLKDAVDHGVTGLRVQPYSTLELAEAIISLLRDDESRAQMSAAAPLYVADLCSGHVVAEKYRSVFESVINQVK